MLGVIRLDEILLKMGGDWRKEIDNFKAMREEVKQLYDAINNCKSIHVETTLAGHAKTRLNLIDKAHQNGYEATLLYVAVNNHASPVTVTSFLVEFIQSPPNKFFKVSRHPLVHAYFFTFLEVSCQCKFSDKIKEPKQNVIFDAVPLFISLTCKLQISTFLLFYGKQIFLSNLTVFFLIW